jgi:hypothetical protein
LTIWEGRFLERQQRHGYELDVLLNLVQSGHQFVERQQRHEHGSHVQEGLVVQSGFERLVCVSHH